GVISPNVSVRAAAARMEALRVGFLVVIDGERVVGVITDNDIAIRVAAKDRIPSTTWVRSIMTTDMLYCREDDDIREASRAMQAHAIRRIPVLDSGNRLTGVLHLEALTTAAPQIV
ncbi:MAG: CBS domain-containing protein, partial [Dehalococcoidia bacterium]